MARRKGSTRQTGVRVTPPVVSSVLNVTNASGNTHIAWAYSNTPGGAAVQVWKNDSSGAPVMVSGGLGVSNGGGTDMDGTYAAGRRYWTVCVDGFGEQLAKSNPVTTV